MTLNHFLAATIAIGWFSVSIDPMNADGAEYFVSLSGNDAWSGTISEPNADRTNGPFRTINRARDAIRSLKATGRINRPVTVCLRDGTHFLSRPFVLTPAD